MWGGDEQSEEKQRRSAASMLGQVCGEVLGLNRGCWSLGKDTSAMCVPLFALYVCLRVAGIMHENDPQLCHML